MPDPNSGSDRQGIPEQPEFFSPAAQKDAPQNGTPPSDHTPSTDGQRAPGARSPRRRATQEQEGGLSPFLTQYLGLKAENPDHLLFFRMGDFFELFFEDAKIAAAILDIALTKRGFHQGVPIPMCGVPVHAASGYLLRLTKSGHKVAIAEQIEGESSARPRSLMRREVVRLITAGTLTEDALLEARLNNYLAALSQINGAWGLAWVDISTGSFYTQHVGDEPAALAATCARIRPSELLYAAGTSEKSEIQNILLSEAVMTSLETSFFDSQSAQRLLHKQFSVKTLAGFGHFSRAELAACGALLGYLELTQRGALPLLLPPRQIAPENVMMIDAASSRNLEITETISGDRRYSLLGVVDRCVTAAGGRYLRAALCAPSTQVDEINARLDAVDVFTHNHTQRLELRSLLKLAPDIERAFARLALGRGSPRDLAAIRDSLNQALSIFDILQLMEELAPRLSMLKDCLCLPSPVSNCVAELNRALASDLPSSLSDGNVIAQNYDQRLDEQRCLRDETRRLTAVLQQRYQKQTGISSLKIKHNGMLGYFIEIPCGQANRLALHGDEIFHHRQTLAQVVRFSSKELVELASNLTEATRRSLAIEEEIFDKLRAQALSFGHSILSIADALAQSDYILALAEIAVEEGWCRPQVDDSRDFVITGGWHPVVKAVSARQQSEGVIANDCCLNPDQRLWLITGPNMAGKSTFLRQNAVLVLLAQIGSYVPAQRACVGIVDRLFSRVGAADDLARGHSTFMSEMIETAAILHSSTDRSLVVLDELGRGTATYDGLSLAWSTIEHLHEHNRGRILFATHYHELTQLSEQLEALSCYHLRVQDWQGQLRFLYRVEKGQARRSYGIEVARLAGVPQAVVHRAAELLAILESGEKDRLLKKDGVLPPESGVAPLSSPSPSPVLARLSSLVVDQLTPRLALDLLYELRGHAKEELLRDFGINVDE